MLSYLFSNALAAFIPLSQLGEFAITALAFAALGLFVFGVSFGILILVTPFSIRKEIEEDQNTSLGVIIGAMLLGIALIISAAIQG